MLLMRKNRSADQTENTAPRRAPSRPIQSGTSIDLKSVPTPDQSTMVNDYDLVFRAAAKAKTRIITQPSIEQSDQPAPAAPLPVRSAQSGPPKHVPAHQRTRVIDRTKPVFTVQSEARAATPSFASPDAEGVDLGLPDVSEAAPADEKALSDEHRALTPQDATSEEPSEERQVADMSMAAPKVQPAAALDPLVLKRAMAPTYEARLIETFDEPEQSSLRNDLQPYLSGDIDEIADTLAASFDSAMAASGTVDLAPLPSGPVRTARFAPTIWFVIASGMITVGLMQIGLILPSIAVLGLTGLVLALAFIVKLPFARVLLGVDVTKIKGHMAPIGSVDDTRDPFAVSPQGQRILNLLPARKIAEAT